MCISCKVRKGPAYRQEHSCVVETIYCCWVSVHTLFVFKTRSQPLGLYAKLLKATVNFVMSFCLSLCLFVCMYLCIMYVFMYLCIFICMYICPAECKKSIPIGSIFMKLDTWIVKEIKQYQEKWLQHVQRMDTNRLPKQALQYKPKRRRNIGRTRKRWRDQLHLQDQETG